MATQQTKGASAARDDGIVHDRFIDEAQAAEDESGAARNLFDLRMIIALLFAIYGVVLTVMGFTSTSDAAIDKAGGVNLNLWGGVGMLILSAFFGVWVALRPLKLPSPAEIETSPDPGPHGH